MFQNRGERVSAACRPGDGAPADRPRDGAPTDSTDAMDADWIRFGVAFADEGAHGFDPDVEWWNESWFWDWFDAKGERAGHVRIGLHPNQGRAFVWAFLLHGEEW